MRNAASEALLNAVNHVVSDSKSKICLFSKANKSFENWLVMELYSRLNVEGFYVQVMPNGGKRVFHDLAFGKENSLENIVEVKIKISATQGKYLQRTLDDIKKLQFRRSNGYGGGMYLLFFSVFESSYRIVDRLTTSVRKHDEYVKKLIDVTNSDDVTTVVHEDFELFSDYSEACELKVILVEIK